MKNLFIAFGIITLLLTSCSIEKRRYTDGYHVEWHHRVKDSKVEATNPSSSLIADAAEQLQPQQIVQLEEIAKEELEMDVVNSKVSEDLAHQKSVRVDQPHLEMRSKVVETKKDEVSMNKKSYSYQNPQQLLIASESTKDQKSDTDTLLLILIAFFISPLAVFLHEGRWNGKCWLNLVLWLLFIFPGFIHALIVILG